MAEQTAKTPLFDAHVASGGKMVDFFGFSLPVSYPTGILKEHRAVREACGMFDVSHMGEVAISGPGALACVQKLITNDAAKLGDGRALYTVMCNEAGGIIDDCIVYRRAADHYLVVVNAATREKDLAWIRDHANRIAGVTVTDESEATALIAVQGPRAVAILSALTVSDLAAVPRFAFITADIAGIACMAARTGYTGEDGFELSCAAASAPALWAAIAEAGQKSGLIPAGLGARDTLRLEARLHLYGQDMDEATTPYEAGLGWVVKLDAKDFCGKAALIAQKAAGPARKLVGFRMQGRGIARPGYAIVDRALSPPGDVIGRVTSGTTGPTVGGAIGLGYVPTPRASPGDSLTIDCRGKDVSAVIVRGPFYKAPQ